MIEINHNSLNVALFFKDNRNFIIDYKNFDIQNVAKAGVKTANVELSKNNKFLVVEKFTLRVS